MEAAWPQNVVNSEAEWATGMIARCQGDLSETNQERGKAMKAMNMQKHAKTGITSQPAFSNEGKSQIRNLRLVQEKKWKAWEDWKKSYDDQFAKVTSITHKTGKNHRVYNGACKELSRIWASRQLQPL